MATAVTPTTTDSATPATPWRTTTVQGDLGVLTYEPLHQPTIEDWVKSPEAGAVVTFVSRDEKGQTESGDSFREKTVTHLEYESYASLALKTLHSVLEAARRLPRPFSEPHAGCTHDGPTERSSHSHSTTSPSAPKVEPIDLTRIAAYHLLGPCPVGTPSIIISVSSPHRKEAFVACEYVLEQIKDRVQVWKREFYKADSGDGEQRKVWVGGDGKGPEDEAKERQGGAKGPSWEWKANNGPIAHEQGIPKED
ncbi:BZ3500_MvSof-1268-A1-R1_Chr1-2g01427 [Microbotryum saponariae]|uniref:BZ3500_MvSof-1268-A1-R1_Chr1-2g01427 protein n=1 Tax=Microbotryum saponariae TaxID=289078 RepID=A0A2X0MYL6_9BASI|nr:BZ3500_MvSof-1268-A1-R1_Chr1-2g01427 [Microbotryum saponariae]SCZ97405.1 BZ3501_MvSof-1269-A2-R1_Chr1-2g01026 [Microbotryum saponariae]